MTAYERDIIKRLRPLLDSGKRGRAMVVYQNLTTKRHRMRECACGCGQPLRQKQRLRFASVMCANKFRRAQGLSKIEKRAWNLRRLGFSTKEIADALNVSKNQARGILQHAGELMIHLPRLKANPKL